MCASSFAYDGYPDEEGGTRGKHESSERQGLGRGGDWRGGRERAVCSAETRGNTEKRKVARHTKESPDLLPVAR